jgi:hypothetical protein
MVRVGKGGRLIVGRVGILGRCGFHHDPDLAGAADAGNAGADATGAGAAGAGIGAGAGEDNVTLAALPMAVSIAL